jgi:hypothetical protein
VAKKEDIYALVGYEQRLHKMPIKELIAEAKRIGIDPKLAAGSKLTLVRNILEAQGANDDSLKGEQMSKLEELITERDRIQIERIAIQDRLDEVEDALLEERFRGYDRYQEGDIILVPRKLFGDMKWWPAKIERVTLHYNEGTWGPHADEPGKPWSNQAIWYRVFLQQKDGKFTGTSKAFDHNQVRPFKEET